MRIAINSIMSLVCIVILGLIPSVQVSIITLNFYKLAILLAVSLFGIWSVVGALVFLVLVGMGFPLLVGGRGGFEVLFSPFFSYLYAYPFIALFIGWLHSKHWKRYSLWTALWHNMLGMFVLFLFSIIGYTAITSIDIFITIKALLMQTALGDSIIIIFVSIIAVLSRHYFSFIVVKTAVDTIAPKHLAPKDSIM